jgi:hypothetical protein
LRCCVRSRCLSCFLLRHLLHTSAYVSIRLHRSACDCIRQHTSAYVSIRQHTTAYDCIRQHTTVYVSIRQHTMPPVLPPPSPPVDSHFTVSRNMHVMLCAYSLYLCLPPPHHHHQKCDIICILRNMHIISHFCWFVFLCVWEGGGGGGRERVCVYMKVWVGGYMNDRM